MKVLLDANVVVAAFAARGLCESLFELCLDSHELVLSEHLLGEIRRNMIKKVKLPPSGADDVVAFLRENSSIVKPVSLPKNVCRDADDVKVLGAAIAGDVGCIVTGDKDLLVLDQFRSIPIMTPGNFSRSLQG